MPPEQRRAQLVRVAVQVAAATGVQRMTHAEVAEQAHVSTPTVFRYFPDREALVTAVIGEVDRFYRAMARQFHDTHEPTSDTLHGHVLAFADSLQTHSEYAIVWLEWSVSFRNEFGLWDTFVDFQEFIIAQLTRTIRGCQDKGIVGSTVSAADSARLITAGSYAVTQLVQMKRSREIVEHFAEQIVNQALA